MKKSSNLWILLVLCFFARPAISQISGKYYGEKEDFKKMAKRTLLIATLEEDLDVIKRLSKKESRAKQLDEYKSFIAQYNQQLKACATKYWTYNANIEFKTESEIKALRKAKSEKYVVLEYFELADSDIDFFERSDLTVPALRYTRIEEPVRKPDYKIYLPSSYLRTGTDYLEADIKVALLNMQDNINYDIKNDATIHFPDYAEKMSEKNCSRLKSLTLLVEKSLLYKNTTVEEAQAAFGGKIEWVEQGDIDKNVVGKTKGKAALFAIPYGLAKGGMGPIHTSRLVFFKVIVDCETGDILWTNNPGSFPVGKNITQFMMEKEFKNAGQCKF